MGRPAVFISAWRSRIFYVTDEQNQKDSSFIGLSFLTLHAIFYFLCPAERKEVMDFGSMIPE